MQSVIEGDLTSKLIMPTGCLEQTMSKLAPNVYVLNYLSAKGKLTSGIKERLSHHVQEGKNSRYSDMIKIRKVLFCNDRNIIIKWTDDLFDGLGVVFTTSENKIRIALNYEPQLAKIQNITSVWRMRDLSLIGKIVVLKSLVLSKLTYLFSTLPIPLEDFFYQL